jgi:protein SCO1/2
MNSVALRFRCRFLYGLSLPVMAIAALTACSNPEPWHVKDISGLMPDLAFTLTDTQGQTVRATDYRNQVLLVYFGYTHCPDVCPATLAQLSSALKKMGPRAQHVRVLFVTVDPARDTPDFLRHYTRYFGPQFRALRGTDEQLRRLTKRYRVTYSRGEPDAQGDYPVSHSNAVFVFDGKGQVRLMIRTDDSVDAIATDLGRLVAKG